MLRSSRHSLCDWRRPVAVSGGVPVLEARDLLEQVPRYAMLLPQRASLITLLEQPPPVRHELRSVVRALGVPYQMHRLASQPLWRRPFVGRERGKRWALAVGGGEHKADSDERIHPEWSTKWPRTRG